MPSLRYLNTILTVLAVLLTVHLWTAWTHPGGSLASLPPAPAGLELATPAHAQIGNLPAEQRQRQIQLLERLTTQVEKLNTLLESGNAKAKVTVENIADLVPKPDAPQR